VAGEPREHLQYRHQNRHRERHGHDEGQREHEYFDDDARRQPFPEQAGELFGDLLDEHQRRERRQREAERRDVLAEEIPADGAHDQWRHYIRKSKSLQDITTLCPFERAAFRARRPASRSASPVPRVAARAALANSPASAPLPTSSSRCNSDRAFRGRRGTSAPAIGSSRTSAPPPTPSRSSPS